MTLAPEAATPLNIVGINVSAGVTAGSVSNAGLINTNDAAIGMFGNIAGDINNSGTLHSNGASAVSMLGVLTGDVINSGMITGNLSALLLSGEGGGAITGNITNTATGTIGDAGTQYAILIRNGAQIGGAITNAANGVIRGTQAGIFISSGTIANGIVNGGTISASQGNALDLNNSTGAAVIDSVSNTVGGQIVATLANGIDVNGATVSQGINNAGAIAAKLSGVQIDSGGVVSAGGIVNTGTIHGNQQAIALITGGIVNGDIRNEGTLTGPVAGIILGDVGSRLNGSLINTTTGSISSDQYGVTLRNSVVIRGDVSNTGSISGTVTGLLVSGATLSNIINSGSLQATQSFALDINSFSGTTSINAISNTASGTITSINSSAVSIANSTILNGISNAGLIDGRNDTSIVLDNTVIGNNGILNSGTISARLQGIVVRGASNVTGDITNASGAQVTAGRYGIDVGTGAHVSGNLVNEGSIHGDNAGIVISEGTFDGDVINSGNVSSHFQSAIIEDGSAGLSSVSRIRNLVGGTLVSDFDNGILVNASTVQHGIQNNGTINGNGDSGIWLANAVVGDGVTNGAGGLITGAHDAILLLDGTTVNGVISNNGTLTGAVNGISLNGGNVSGTILNNGQITGATGNGIELNDLTAASTADTISNTAQGVINAPNGAAISLAHDTVGNGATVLGTLINAGRLNGGTAGISISNSTVGTIQNLAGATVTGTDGLNSSNSIITSGLTNAGTITGRSGAGGSGVTLTGTTVQAGGISNSASGVITGDLYGLKIDGGSLVTGDIVNDGTLSATGTGLLITGAQLSGHVRNNGIIAGHTALDTSGATVPLIIDNAGLLDGDVVLGASTLNLNGAANQISGSLSGSAASVVNVNTAYTTAQTVSVGTLNIGTGATFRTGSDITVANELNNAGTLATSSQTPITINGNYTQSAAGTFSTSVLSPTSYGRLIVNGQATLAAGTHVFLDVSAAATLEKGLVLNSVIQGQAGQLDASAINVSDNSALYDFSSIMNGDSIDFVVERGLSVRQSVVAARRYSALGAAGVFDTLLSSNSETPLSGAINALGRLATEQQVAAAVSQTLPLLSGATTTLQLNTNRQINAVLQSRQEDMQDSASPEKSVWVKPFGGWSSQLDQDGAEGFSSRTNGLVIGTDTALSAQNRVGAAFAYSHVMEQSNAGTAPQSASLVNYQLLVFGQHTLSNQLSASWQADVGRQTTEGRRTITFTDTPATAAAAYAGWNAHVGVGLARLFALSDATSITPAVRLNYVHMQNRSYSENGAGPLNLHISGQSAQAFTVTAATRIRHAVSTHLALTAAVGVDYDLLKPNSTVAANFDGGGGPFLTTGVQPARLRTTLGGGMSYEGDNKVTIVGRYDVELSRGATNQQVSLKIMKSF